MKTKRKIIEIDNGLCNGCGQCALACAEGAIEIIDNKARVVSDTYCDGLGACIGECPQNALKIIDREAEEFDERSVQEHRAEKKKWVEAEKLSHQCPSARIKQFAPHEAPEQVNTLKAKSALSTWPVQIRLVPPHAPFLQGADLLVVSDCTPFAYHDFHRDFMAGRVLLTGCPKFDDRELYTKKFADIFRLNAVKSVTVVVMEVPCCQGMPMIVSAGMDESGKKIPMETVIIGIQGEILKRVKIAA
jgi:ferredoxin